MNWKNNSLKDKQILTTSEPNVDNKKMRLVEGEHKNEWYFSPTSEECIKIRYTAHHLKWSWKVEGTTKRVPIKTVKMNNWTKYIYNYKGATVVLNPNTFELWLKSRAYKPKRNASGIIRMIYTNWSKADRLAREFSEFAQIALKPIHTVHPGDIEKAHLVMTTKTLNPILKPMSEVKDDVGLIFDKSHPGQPEFAGEKAVEGAVGAEWFFTKFPEVVRHQVEMDTRFAKNLDTHLTAINEIRDAIRELRDTVKKNGTNNKEKTQ